MYKRYLIAILALILMAVSTSHAGSWNGWIYQNPYPTSNHLYATKFVTPDKGWIAGVQGTILYTEDGGDTWESQESGTEQDIRNMFFINDKTGWAVGNRGAIIHTEDGGKKWSTQTNAKSALNSVIFINEKEGWAAGDQGTVLHTTDGGKKWTKKDIGAKRSIGSIHFIKPETGWILAGDEVYRTKDSGKNWEKAVLEIKMPRPGALGKETMSFINVIGETIPPDWWKGEIHFTDEKNGWAVVGLWYIFHTEDGGKTWKDQLKMGSVSYILSHVTFTDSKKGCATGTSILCTEDGGNTWKERLGIKLGGIERINDFLIDLWGISFTNQSTGWTVGNDGQMMKTEDGGKTWTMEARRDKCGGNAFFVDKKTGWLHGRFLPASVDYICRTDDAGRTWEKQKVGVTVWDIFFIDHLTGWAVGEIEEGLEGEDPSRRANIYGAIRYTTDGGKTWITQFKELMGKKISEDGLYRVFFVDRDTGWAVGVKGTILHTEDGGKMWIHQKKETPELYLRGLWFIDSKVGWIIGYKLSERWTGPILYTEDGGKHWQTKYQKENVAFGGVYFMDKNSGWITGETEDEDCILLHTDNGGRTWSEKVFSGIGESYPVFLDKKRGILASTESGRILITNDGGKTWTKKRKPLHKYPRHFSEIFEKGKP